MNIYNLLHQERILAHADASSKKKVLETLSRILAQDISNYSQEQIFNNLTQRERLGSTGLGSGIALPHCRLAGLARPSAAMLTLDNTIDFDSPDGQGVDIIFGLVVPDNNDSEHLKTLARLARLFSDIELCQQLRNADNNQEILALINHRQQDVAA